MSEQTDYSRRGLLRRIGGAMTLAAAGGASAWSLTAQDAQHVHQALADDRAAQQGTYQPKALTRHEYATLDRLSGLILPADEHSPGAVEAGAAAFIDFLCAASDEMLAIYTGGIAWLDDTMRRRTDGQDFLHAPAGQQTALLDLIAWRKNRSPELNSGIHFFTWARRMVADAYYTSPIGFKELGYMGNQAMSHFSVPEEAVDYVMKRSPLG